MCVCARAVLVGHNCLLLPAALATTDTARTRLPQVKAKGRAAKGAKVSQSTKGVTAAKGNGLCWAVEVLHQGVGGFAIGVASASDMCKPFKSLGNQPTCWVWHSSGTVMHNRTRSKENEARAYGVGAKLSVQVDAGGRVVCTRDGTPVDLPFPLLPLGKYVLCCQPYMGGAAQLCGVAEA